ncbi:hypothetical protein CFP71_02880 [Amycolatopsis thailandensis]|uniref:Uncharacterized protein n=1 Tax=Amycolatopsis thailandensis TaxID=589330 RepID=A0A229SHZ7_9PSEU|nr:terpene synthase family protein [Amycolatopsis thailandensis]OXM58500.1 hypothetical protein CFP71_02880 [Amycolatopsis thailandensis]
MSGGRLREWAGAATLTPPGYPGDLVPLRHAEFFACHSYPGGDPERLAVIARLLTLWTTDDDVSERWGIEEEHAQAVLGVLRGTRSPRNDYLREWSSVGTALRDGGMSEEWLRLLFADLETWYRSARYPERGRRETRDQYWRRRLDGTGAVPWLDLLEYVHERELTPAQRNAEQVRNAYTFAAQDYVLAFNDPTSVERDAEEQVPNLCTLTASERSIPPAEAVAELAREHLRLVRRPSCG